MKLHTRLIFLLLLCLLPFGCGSDRANEDAAAAASPVWQLSDRYQATYGTIRHAYTYEKDGQTLYLTVGKNKRTTPNVTETVVEQKTKGDRTYLLCKANNKGQEEAKNGTYYQCLTGTYRYTVDLSDADLQIETLLSMDEAIKLIEQPTAEIAGLKHLSEEWSAFYRLESCNLEILIDPNDGGSLYRQSESTYESRTENGETYLCSNDTIVYTDGSSSVLIRQANRSGAEHVSYITLSECKAILAMLGTK